MFQQNILALELETLGLWDSESNSESPSENLRVAMEGRGVGGVMVGCWFGYSMTLLLVHILVFRPLY